MRLSRRWENVSGRTMIWTSVAAVVATVAVSGGAYVLVGAEQPAAVGAVFSQTATWDTGYTAQYVITNSSGETKPDWTLEFDLPAGGQISSLWDGTSSVSGQHVTVKPPGWDTDGLAAGQSATVGFVVHGTGDVPANCSIDGAPCSGSGGPAPAPKLESPPPPAPAPDAPKPPIGEAPPPKGPETAAAPPPAGSGGNGGSGGDLPKHAVTGYWQNFNNGATVQKIADVPDQYDIIAVAFADATTPPGSVSFTLDSAGLGGYTVDQFKADIAAKHAAGKKVVISVGGQNGTVSITDAASATNFANSIFSLMQSYGFDGVDIDLENGLDATYMSQALKALSAKAGPSLIITMAPQTIDMQSASAGYFQTALNIKDILTVVNMQYYNSGSMQGCDGKIYSQGTVDFITALACIQLEGGLSPSQVGLGVPASASAAGSGYVDPSVMNNALDCLTKGENCGSFKPSKTYPDLRGAMTWSTSWDASAGNAWSSSVGPHVHELP